MSTKGDHSPDGHAHTVSGSAAQVVEPVAQQKATESTESSSSINDDSSAPRVAGYQEVVDALWPTLMKGVEAKMTQLEQELIKRHNIKMMNEMQEVVRQIKQAKTKNDEVLRDYHKKQTDLTRSVLEVAEKYATLRAELEELKRQALVNKQQVSHRCDQTTDQVAQLKHAVFTAWQKEKTEIQQKVSQSYRGDLALVLGQFDAKLRDSFSETSKLRYEVKRLTAKMNGEDPDAVAFEVPSYVDTAVAAVSRLPAVDASPPVSTLQSSAEPFEPASQSASASATATPAPAGVNLASLTQNLAAFIARQQAGGPPAGGPPQVNVAMLQQFMQTLPRQQQLQLQMLLQQHRAQQSATATATTSPAPTTPLLPPGLGLTPAQTSPQPAVSMSPGQSAQSLGQPSTAPAPAAAPGTPAATMIQSLAHQLQLQVESAQQKAATAGAAAVACPFFAMFGWCKFGDKCRYVHSPTGKEPLRNLPQSVIQTLQTQLASGATAETTQTLMTALAGIAARQTSNGGSGGGVTVGVATPAVAAPAAAAASASTNSVQQAMIQAQIQAQQEAAQMGAAKAKTIACRFFAIGRCAYGDRCAYSHAAEWRPDTSSSVAAAAAAAWGKTDLQKASWGAPTPQRKTTGEDTTGIIDGEDDTSYDQWNAMTFDDATADNNSAPPPGL